MDGPQDTSANDMSFELTGPAIIIPNSYEQFNPATKRDFTTFSDDDCFRPVAQNDPQAFNGNISQHISTIANYGEEGRQRLTSWLQWGFFRSLEAIQITSNFLQAVYAATLIASMPVAAAKRRLVSFTPDIPVPAPIRRVLLSRSSRPRIFRQHPSPAPGQRATTPITPPRFKYKPLSPFHIPGNFPVSPPRSLDNQSKTPTPTKADVHDGTSISPHEVIDIPMDPALDALFTDGDPITSNTFIIDDVLLSDEPLIDESVVPVFDQLSPVKVTAAPPSSYQVERADELKAIRELFDATSSLHAKKKCGYSARPKPVTSTSARSSPKTLEQSDSVNQLITTSQQVLDANGSTSTVQPLSDASGQPNHSIQQVLPSNPSTVDQHNSIPDESIESTRSSSHTSGHQGASVQTAPSSNPNTVDQHNSVPDESIESTRSLSHTSGLQGVSVQTAPSSDQNASDQHNSVSDELIESTRSSSHTSTLQVALEQPNSASDTSILDQNGSTHHTNDILIEPIQSGSNTSGLQDVPGQLALGANTVTDTITFNAPTEQTLAYDDSIKSTPANASEDSAISGYQNVAPGELIELTRSSPNALRQHDSSGGQDMGNDKSIESTRSSSNTSKENHPAHHGLIRSTRSPTNTSTKQGSLHTILKTAKTPSPKKGLFGQLIFSLKNKNRRTSPLREKSNGANAVPKTPINKYARFHENPVTRTKKYIKDEAISFPSAHSSRDGNSILDQTSILDVSHVSPTQQEQDVMIANQLMTFVEEATTSLAGAESPEPHINPEGFGSAHSESPSNSSGQEPVTPTETENAESTTPPNELTGHFAGLDVTGRRSSRRTQDRVDLAEQQRLEEERLAAEEKAWKERVEAEEKARKAKAEAEEIARKQAEEEEEKKKRALRMPIDNVIPPLTQAWEQKLATVLALGPNRTVAHTSQGTPITRRDIGKVLPQQGTQDPSNGWLNDAIIDAYLQAIVDHGNEAAGHKRGEIPKFHAFNNFFYNNLKEGGVEKVRRWAKKAKIGGKDLLSVEWVFIPVNVGGSHWTLIAVSPTRRTIEYYDSFHGRVSSQFRDIKAWLKSELGSDYHQDEWKVVEDPMKPGMGKGPSQYNGRDCGVFTVTTAKMISLGVDPMAYGANDVPMQRKRMVAELIHGGFTDEFKPNMRFE